MTDRDPRTGSGGGAKYCAGAGGAPPEIGFKIPAGVGEELLHRLAAVVAGDVGMEVLPDALDAIGIGTVRREEVQNDPAAERVENATSRVRRVDAVVVDDEVDSADAAPIAGSEEPQQLAEEGGVLAGGPRGVELARS